MLVVGLTGGIGAGKSTVGQYLRAFGVRVIDADTLVHECLNKKSIQKRIVRIFGREILNSDGGIDKKKLAEVVFQDRQKLRKLEGILHPSVIREIEKEVMKARQKHDRSILAVIVPLLFEKHLERLFDKTVVITSLKRLRISRAAKHLKIKPNEVIGRMRYQLPASVQQKMADLIIRNNGTSKKLKKEVEKLIQKLKEENNSYGSHR